MNVVVVDNGSTDDTALIAERFGATIVSAPGVLVGAVRNRGATLARDGVVAFIDGDCVAGTEWLLTATIELAVDEVGIAGGGYVPNPEGTWVEKAWASGEPKARSEVNALPGGSMIFRTAEFEWLGGFDETLSAGEDDEICSRMRKTGKQLIANPKCYVTHLGYPERLTGVLRRQIWHGSNQLDVAESIDVQLILTHMFAIGTAVSMLGAVAWSVALFYTGLTMQAVPAVTFTVGKLRQRRRRIVLIPQLLAIAWFFYSGRSIGLLKNYRRLAIG